jgi:arginine-tRNA-protein transferase
VAQSRAFWAEKMPGEVYHALMEAGFRRSGQLVYQPICRGCRECLPIRVPVDKFSPSKSQRRCYRQNQDLSVSVGSLQSSDEKWLLYQRYVAEWHQKDADDRSAFESFLYESPVDTVEFCYRDSAGTLLAVGICDICGQSLSSVYFYFDPKQAQRGLGTFGALHELDFARNRNIPYYYLGYWIDECPSMQYKAMYRVHEILHPDNVWRAGK